ncbi:hypothetical protein [Neobacillus ginsengisoli]|uniref:Antibiotic biosynthesis monooxygenase (ABM) superfamily enzyme n=1 Tax=Neobacillus ginsengisoli TaxID=904295 RepID=A0ABT9XNL1_9BACI|nr:hypothetical protein [Neobacillus ginsengisoli]MDQ0197125.1 antibiotic biosynthesis monooxygenase (ABM) superfamily enzyme [Neobacillus ginsengisoli]
MKGKFKKYAYHPWYRTCRRVCGQFIIPFLIFQLIRTILLPTFFDVLLLTFFFIIAISLFFEII